MIHLPFLLTFEVVDYRHFVAATQSNNWEEALDCSITVICYQFCCKFVFNFDRDLMIFKNDSKG